MSLTYLLRAASSNTLRWKRYLQIANITSHHPTKRSSSTHCSHHINTTPDNSKEVDDDDEVDDGDDKSARRRRLDRRVRSQSNDVLSNDMLSYDEPSEIQRSVSAGASAHGPVLSEDLIDFGRPSVEKLPEPKPPQTQSPQLRGWSPGDGFDLQSTRQMSQKRSLKSKKNNNAAVETPWPSMAPTAASKKDEFTDDDDSNDNDDLAIFRNFVFGKCVGQGGGSRSATSRRQRV